VFVPWLFAEARKSGVARYVAGGANRTSAVHVDDAADLYLLALEKATAGSLYHGAAEHGVTAHALAEAVARAGGYKTESVSRDEALTLWGPQMVAFLSINNQIDSSKAAAELGWRPRAAPKLLEDVARGSYRP
jgi:nucleoside-diphosphate-sugar epimerase